MYDLIISGYRFDADLGHTRLRDDPETYPFPDLTSARGDLHARVLETLHNSGGTFYDDFAHDVTDETQRAFIRERRHNGMIERMQIRFAGGEDSTKVDYIDFMIVRDDKLMQESLDNLRRNIEIGGDFTEMSFAQIDFARSACQAFVTAANEWLATRV